MQNHIEFRGKEAEFKMIFVEGGVFEMGSNNEETNDSEKPIHKVRLSNYWMGEYPVTQALWAYVMSDTDIIYPSYFKGVNRPVEQVSWEDIDEIFLPRLNDKTKDNRLEDTYYRLPTEAEWEYAARGGKYWELYQFDYAGSNKLEEVGWYGYDENSHRETQVVGLKRPNLLELYDMSGNVWEWCSDWYDSYLESSKGISVNPTGPLTGTFRVLRGGSWTYSAGHCRATRRDNHSPTLRDDYVGFRLVLSFSPVQ